MSQRGSSGSKEFEKCCTCSKQVSDRSIPADLLAALCPLPPTPIAGYSVSSVSYGILRNARTCLKKHRVLTKNESMHSFCKRCNASVNKVIMNIARLQSKVEDIERNVSLIKHESETMKADAKDELNGMKSKIDQLAESVSNTAIQQVDVRLGEVDNNLQEVSRTIQETREQAAEQREKEARKNNIIIHRMPESAANVVEQRRKDDHDFLFELMQNVLDTQCEADVGKIVRLGKRQEGTNRPVLVKLKNRSTKT